MNTLLMTVFGILFSIALCLVMKAMFLLGYGEPNVIPEAGETYLGWWLMLFFTTAFAGTLCGMIVDTFGLIQRCLRKD